MERSTFSGAETQPGLGAEGDLELLAEEGLVRAVLAEFVSYYNQDRPHRSLGLETLAPSRRQADGKVASQRVLGGLHHVYERAT